MCLYGGLVGVLVLVVGVLVVVVGVLVVEAEC